MSFLVSSAKEVNSAEILEFWQLHSAQEIFLSRWSRASLMDSISSDAVLTARDSLSGTLCGLCIFTNQDLIELEIHQILVGRSFRRQGVARLLISGLREARPKSTIGLELNENNRAAFSFYASLGFAQVGRRKSYYQVDQADALVLSLGPA